MADIRENGWEWFHYDNPDFQVQFRRNYIPAGVVISDIKSIHWHDDIEFIYVLKGATHYEMANTSVKMKAGEGIFVNSRQLHLIHADKDEDCELLCLIFHPIILCSTDYITENYVKPLIEDKSIPYVHLKSIVPWQKKVLEDIAKMEPFCNDERGHIKVMNYIYDLWDELFLNLVEHSDDEAMNQDLSCMKKMIAFIHKNYRNKIKLSQICEAGNVGKSKCNLLFLNLVEHSDDEAMNQDLSCMKKMIAFIHKNYRNKIKLSQICEAGNVGKSKCNLLFEKYYNVSPIEYVKNYRIEQGAKLLTLSDMSITQIAYEVGFLDGSYFSKAFSEKIGITPNKYRGIGREMSSYYELPQSQGL